VQASGNDAESPTSRGVVRSVLCGLYQQRAASRRGQQPYKDVNLPNGYQPDTHVDDITSVIEMGDLKPVSLVHHPDADTRKEGRSLSRQSEAEAFRGR
jgi:hypothetical protein